MSDYDKVRSAIQLNQISKVRTSNLGSLKNVIIHNSSVTHLEIIRMYLDEYDGDYIAYVIRHNTHILEINVVDVDDSPDGVDSRPFNLYSIAEALKVNSVLQALDLSEFFFCDVEYSVKYMAGALKINSTLQKIDLSRNRIGVEGARLMAEALKINSTLQKIGIAVNNIGNQGAKFVADAIKMNSTLKEINLAFNDIDDQGAKYFVEAIKENSSLQKINFAGNNIKNRGAKRFAELIKVNFIIEEIDLRENGIYIGADGAKWMIEAIKLNTCVQRIRLADNFIRESFISHIEEFLRENRKRILKFICAFTRDRKELIRLRFDKMILRYVCYPIMGVDDISEL
jgi:hypothetical protein